METQDYFFLKMRRKNLLNIVDLRKQGFNQIMTTNNYKKIPNIPKIISEISINFILSK